VIVAVVQTAPESFLLFFFGLDLLFSFLFFSVLFFSVPYSFSSSFPVY
jgi:hypothetical protein